MNVTRNPISARPLTLLAGLTGLLLVHAQVRADVPMPPPTAPHSAGFPSENALKNMGYDPNSGVWRAQETNRGKPTVKKDGGNITGTQGRNVTVTGKYGEKVNINTSVNQTANVDKLQVKAAGALYGGMAAGNAIGSDAAAQAYKDFKSGDYEGGFQKSIEAVLSGLSSFDITGLGNGIVNFGNRTGLFNLGQKEFSEELQNAQNQAERDGDLAGALTVAQAQKIAQEAAEAAVRDQQSKEAAQEQLKQGKQIWVLEFYYGVSGTYAGNKFVHFTDKNMSEASGSVAYYRNGKIESYAFPDNPFNQYFPKTISFDGYTYAFLTWSQWDGKQDLPTTQPTPENLQLTQTEIAEILRRMLESNQTNHAELMRQLSMMGNVVSESTTNITYNQTTAQSAPYTPQGSNQAQQTQATIHPDGSVTTTIIPRPDLKPDSSQAPTRQQVTPDAPNQPSTPQNPDGQHNQSGQNQQDKDFCDKHPDSLMCAEGGNADYEDVAIPHKDIPLDFSPADIFATDGVCPKPRYVDLGIYGRQEFSYDGICDLARKLRPLFILSTILACAYFIYASLDK